MGIKTFLIFIVSLFFILFLTACSSAPASTPTPTPVPTAIPATPLPEVGCSVISAEPTPKPSSALPAITSADYVRGPDNASVTLIVYCEFQSGQCQVLGDILDKLQANHPNDARVVFRPLPAASLLDKSQITVQAVIAAGNQGKFWEMRAILRSKYNEWINLSAVTFEPWAVTQAAGLGLDGAKFKTDLTSVETAARAKSMGDAAKAAGITSIPIVFVNGNPQPAYVLNYTNLDATVSLIALGARQFKSCPPFVINPAKQYIATVRTEKGDIVIQLFPDKAPLAVNSFVFLARNNWFNGVTFHSVIPGFIAQAGDPSGTGRGGPGYFFKNEITDLKYDRPGLVGVANSGPDTNGSQFFITFAPQPKINGAYTIFGQVIQGMDVVESLTPRDPSKTPGLPPGDQILNVTIEEK
ncbi:MAG: peptidylprolyl isomerase [Chloroflexi bacterium]|nr:peptidylprolyl isomerase [Chloroflexota bacterium]